MGLFSSIFIQMQPFESEKFSKSKKRRGYRSSIWQNLTFEDRIRMASQGDFRSSKASLTNQEMRLKQQRQQIDDGLY